MTRNGAGVLLILVLAAIGLAMIQQPKTSTADSCTAERAIAAAEEFVRRSLKAPSTARFQEPRRVEDRGGCVYSIVGDVDAENGFGAMLRTGYSINVRHDRDAAGWRADNLRLD